MTLVKSQDAMVNNRPARLLHVRQKAGVVEVLKWMLIAGDEGTTVMIVGTYPLDSSPALAESIRLSLLSASWNRSGQPDAFEGLPFRVTGTPKLKLARRVSNMLMFTESGTTGSPGSTEALYLVGHSIGSGKIGDLRSFAERRARQTTHVTGVGNFTGRPVEVDTLVGYELEADAIDARAGTPLRLYQVIVPDDTGYFIAQGLIRADRAADLFPEFRAITASFRRIGSR
jgi:hypothetical protein